MDRRTSGFGGLRVGSLRVRSLRLGRMRRAVPLVAVLAMLGLVSGGPGPGTAPLSAEAAPSKLPPPPADGVMGFVVSRFAPMIVRDAACPVLAPRMREAYLETLPQAERERLSRKENEPELATLWKATAFGPGGTNVCSNPEMFDRPPIPSVQSKLSEGMDLDGGDPGQSCEHEAFSTPRGETGIDNQEYRAMGCTLEWRGLDGTGGDQLFGSQQFHASGEWTQVMILRGVDSLENDPDVEVVYGNTPDRPLQDTNRKFLPGASFTLSDTAPRHRNALKGRIVNRVLTTEPKDILLTQTWGQGGARDIRGTRTAFDLRRGRLRLEFQPDGTLRGMVGGYKPLFDVFSAQALGGAGTALVGGMDCSAYLATLRKFADGIRNPKTGKCEGVSSAIEIQAVPAFVADAPTVGKVARRANR